MNRSLLPALALLLVAVVGCGAEDEPSPGSAASRGPSPLPTGDQKVDLDPADFTAGSDHRYFPLEPGRQWTYREVEDGATLEVVVTVSSETYTVAAGVEARVVRDTVTEDGELIEDTLDWYAQDSDGNVWYLGEQTAEFENGKLATREGSFEAGKDGAQAGIIMPAEPVAGMAYRQEYLAGEAEDNGAVLATGQQVETEAGHWDDALLTADSITLEPDVLEYKIYAPDVGLALTLDVSGGSAREELVSTRTVDAATARRAGTAPLGTPYA
jgi:hypothetical protein